MLHPYADLQFSPQPQFRDAFKLYFKRNLKNKNTPKFKQDTRALLTQHQSNHHQQSTDHSPRCPLRIAIVTETWPPEINGVALSLLQLCSGLQQLGHQILLIRPIQKEACPSFQADQECLVRAQSIPKYQGLQFGWPQYAKVSQAVEQFAPDIVHVVTEGPLGLTALQVAKRFKIPVSSGFHSPFQDFSRFFDLAFLLKPIQHYLRWFHNHTQLTCVPSRDTEQALRDFGVQCPLVVVGRGVDTTRFSPEHRCEKLRQSWGVDDETTVLLSVGRLSPEKEIDLIIETFATLKQQNKKVKLIIVGDGPDRERLQQMTQQKHLTSSWASQLSHSFAHLHQIKNMDESQSFISTTEYTIESPSGNLKPDLNLAQQSQSTGAQQQDVIFTGSLSGEALAQVYASADVFLFASQVETFGNVVLEAMASGLAVVAFDYACAQQYVVHQQSGWLSPRGDQDGFKRAILNLPHPTLIRQMGECAVQATQGAGWQAPVRQLEAALYQVTRSSLR